VTYPVEITNTDPRIIKIFLEFLRKDIKVDEKLLKVQIQIHEGDSLNKLEDYWSKVTGIPRKRFNKTIIHPNGKKHGKGIGTCKIRYTNKDIYLNLKSSLEVILQDIGV